jgi:hypothetical protein
LLIEAFKRIHTERPSRFLATFATSLLYTVSRAFETIVDDEKLDVLHNLMTSFIDFSSKFCNRDSKEGKEVAALLDGFLTTYAQIYLGGEMLLWSGRYWEQSHPIPPNRFKSTDLIDSQLNSGFLQLTVRPVPKHY